MEPTTPLVWRSGRQNKTRTVETIVITKSE